MLSYHRVEWVLDDIFDIFSSQDVENGHCAAPPSWTKLVCVRMKHTHLRRQKFKNWILFHGLVLVDSCACFWTSNGRCPVGHWSWWFGWWPVCMGSIWTYCIFTAEKHMFATSKSWVVERSTNTCLGCISSCLLRNPTSVSLTSWQSCLRWSTESLWIVLEFHNICNVHTYMHACIHR